MSATFTSVAGVVFVVPVWASNNTSARILAMVVFSLPLSYTRKNEGKQCCPTIVFARELWSAVDDLPRRARLPFRFSYAILHRPAGPAGHLYQSHRPAHAEHPRGLPCVLDRF